MPTVDLVIFACVNFREFLLLGLFTKFRTREFLFFLSSTIIIIIFEEFLNSRSCPPRKYYQIYSIAYYPCTECMQSERSRPSLCSLTRCGVVAFAS